MNVLFKRAPKEHLVRESFLLLIVFIFMSCGTTKSQVNSTHKKEYDIINAHFNKGDDLILYHKSVENASWIKLINIDSITDRVGIPTFIEDEELRKLLTEKVLSEVRTTIHNSTPLMFSKTELPNLKLSATNDSKNIKISKPVIVGNLAFLRRIDDLEIPIYIYKYDQGKWHIIYTFYEKLILR